MRLRDKAALAMIIICIVLVLEEIGSKVVTELHAIQHPGETTTEWSLPADGQILAPTPEGTVPFR